MDAGRELDVLIAERVMELVITDIPFRLQDAPANTYWTDRAANQLKVPWDASNRIPSYSTNIAAAWQIVEKIRAEYVLELHDHSDYWRALFLPVGDSRYYTVTGDASTAPLAICLAALNAIDMYGPTRCH